MTTWKSGERVPRRYSSVQLPAWQADILIKRYGNINEVATKALEEFVADVRGGVFPDAEHAYAMKADEVAALDAALSSGE